MLLKLSAWLELKLWQQRKIYFERAFLLQVLPLKTKLKGEKLYDMNQPTRGYLSDKLVHIILLSIASVGLDGKISSLPAADSGDVTNHIIYSVASCSADVGN